ncbi:hypothetical protein C0Q70_08236 [Pomacea canaliculata]|uniref:Uncharacterized protein n=1 Tax=Pomacea canaliculata TaxID=400727 RepID=A0A2T7PHC3_POMCA|nr:hypothetical protein C0Q70_08236 [Pomacea canaliculata]
MLVKGLRTTLHLPQLALLSVLSAQHLFRLSDCENPETTKGRKLNMTPTRTSQRKRRRAQVFVVTSWVTPQKATSDVGTGTSRDRVTMKKMTGGGHVHGSDYVQTWKKNSIEEHRLQDKLRDLVAKRNSCIQHLCEKEKEVRLNVKSQGRLGTSRLPQQKSLESDGILTDTSFVSYDRQRRASLQLDRQTLSTIRPADARTNDMNDPSSSSPSSCHRRRFSIHHESTSMGTWFGPGLAEHSSTRDAGSRQRRGSLDGSIPSGLTFGSPPVRKQSLTHGFGLQKSMDTTSQVEMLAEDEINKQFPVFIDKSGSFFRATNAVVARINAFAIAEPILEH